MAQTFAIPREKRRFLLLSWVCAFSPFALLLVFLSLGVHIRLGLGHWPIPMTEDYHSLAFSVHEWILVVGLYFVLFIAGPLWLVCFAVPPLRPPWPRTVISQLVICALSWLLIWAIIVFDPTTFSQWFLD